ncbi:MAG: DNA-protecting protein DprA [Acidimicrobiales bacterium]|nr:DNA-protecting protein DprA [Acidimicrobiales bacterium]
MSAVQLPQEAFAVALLGLPRMGPARLLALTDGRSPAEAWFDVVAGRALARPEVRAACAGSSATPDEVAAGWRAAAREVDVGEVLGPYGRVGAAILLRGRGRYPEALADDPEAPLVLCARGAVSALEGPRACIVGTRRCTYYGRQVAAALGRDLAGAGVRVLSGLAAGVDGAAHRGALAAAGAPPVAVVGTGIDVPYPRGHVRLWEQVATEGLLLSEAPLGAPADGWRFPARNRILAALADVVVVVESHAAGGSLYTVDAAQARDRPVLAVPGPVTSPASAGCNQLLVDGCHPARDADDVLVALGLVPGGRRRRPDRRPAPSPPDRCALDALGVGAASLEQVAQRCRITLGEAAAALSRLEADGWVAALGAFWQRVERP